MCDIRDWFSLLCSRGLAYGYFPEPTKSLVVVDEHFILKLSHFFRVWEFALCLVIGILEASLVI